MAKANIIKNVSQEVKERIKEMTSKKAAELAEINEKKAEAQTRKEIAEASLKEATEQMDLEAFEKAKEDIRKAKTAIDMYSGRYDQLQHQEYISEEESDKVIDSLLDYERELEFIFLGAIKEPLHQLQSILSDYFADVEETERVIKSWGRDIRANYSTRGQALYTDKETGIQTDRSPYPVEVHSVLYKGCKEAIALENYIKNAPM